MRWIAFFLIEMCSFYMIREGLKKREESGETAIRFRVSHLFQNRSIENSSGTQLLIEGFFGVYLGLFLIFFSIFR